MTRLVFVGGIVVAVDYMILVAAVGYKIVVGIAAVVVVEILEHTFVA